MPLTREKKEQVVEDTASLLSSSKMTVIASYRGTPVKAMQQLRKQAADKNTEVKVIKNRLVIQAIKNVEAFKDIDVKELNGMLVYAFNPEDEVTAAQTLADFAKTNPTLEFKGAISSEGSWLSADEIKMLATLPNKETLIGTVITILYSPIRSVIGSTQGGLPAIISALSNK